MAKTKGPLLSLDAHGTVADLLTYSSKRSGSQVRRYNKPLKPASAKQRAQRRLTEFLVAQWQNMSAGDKATWEAAAAASNLNLEGYHYFLREAQRDLYKHTGLCGYWHCNEIVGGKILDLSGNAIHGTLKPDYPANAPVLVDSYKTKLSKGLLYDGVDEYVDLGNNAILNPTTKISVELLIKPTMVDGGIHVVATLGYSSPTHKGLDLEITAANKLIFKLGNGALFRICTANVEAVQNSWYHVIGTWDGTTVKLHINNVTQDDTELLAGPIVYDDSIDRLGSAIANFYGGIIDEVCIYNRYLSDGERAARYKFAMREVD